MQESMAKQTNISMPARKLRRVINELRGKSALEAAKILKFMPYFAARVVEKNLVAAIANANEKFGANAEDLKISEIFADESATYKRGKPRAQGRIYRRLKRTSHLTVKLASSKN
ncbi:MAG: 50S ribosomal protein L22 [Candidatus Gastranaerophilaceae bacterium]|jgi:ribosomal protein L22|nr:50S ribosomal protein L22 [Clostridium sp. CAG:306]